MGNRNIEGEGDVLLLRVKSRSWQRELKHVNIMWDGGSTLSFITFWKVKEMWLTNKGKVRLQIVQMGGTIEEIDSFNYDIDLVDISGNDIRLSVMGVERIPSDTRAINMNEIKDMFRSANLNYLMRPEYGEVDLLVGYEYADFHPTKKEANGHLLLLENRFGLVLWGKFHTLKQRREGFIFTQVNKVETKIDKFLSDVYPSMWFV